MNQKTLDLVHQAYAKACKEKNVNAVSVAENLYNILSTESVEKADARNIDLFLNKLLNCISARKLTFQATNLCTDVLEVMMYIVAWVNEDFEKEIDVNISARRKSLESELAKAMEIASKGFPTQIKDRFGIRFIMLNPENGINLSCFLAPKILNVLCKLDMEDLISFDKFVNKLDNDTKERILKVLRLPFVLEEIKRTDDPSEFDPSKFPEIDLPADKDRELVAHLEPTMKFYFDPKKKGYQSIHFVLALDSFSERMPGFKIELQFRTWKMHQFAENDKDASHDAHKSKVDQFTQVFTLSSKEQQESQISGFNSYKDAENDIDGIHFPKSFSNRRINRVSLPSFK